MGEVRHAGKARQEMVSLQRHHARGKVGVAIAA
jgi:hypothetical protein